MIVRWVIACSFLTGTALAAGAADWPQWRGVNRDAKVTGFVAPTTWPKELTRKWSVPVGDGVATPALVGDLLYVFTRQGENEVVRCLDTGSGKEVWKDEYKSEGVPPQSGAREYSGPRASPAVADGKVVTFGTRGILSCFDAASGKPLWRKDEFKGSWPMFFVASSPMIVDGLCIAHLGGKAGGGGKGKGGKDHSAVVAYDLASGAEKWRWEKEAADYSSPVLATVGREKVLVLETDRSVVVLKPADGVELWKAPHAPPRFPGYNAPTPVVDGSTIFIGGSGRGLKALTLDVQGGKFEAKELWNNTETSLQYNTPVVKDGLLYGISNRDQIFCVDTKSQKTAWIAPLKGNRGYGSVVDAGSVLFALTPAGTLTVFEPSAQEFKTIASYKVADKGTYAYPVIAGNRVFIKDQNNLTLFTIE